MKFFGKPRTDSLLELSMELGAHYEPARFFKPAKITLPYRNFEITLDWYFFSIGKNVVAMTRMRAPFVSRQPFVVTISPMPYRWFYKLFGMKSLSINDEAFNKKFRVQGSPEELVTCFLQNDIIRELLAKKKGCTFKVMDNEGRWSTYPPHVDVIHFTIAGALKDAEQLKDLFALFTYSLDELVKIGCASEDDPHMKL